MSDKSTYEELEQKVESLEDELRITQDILDAIDDTVFVFNYSNGKSVKWNRSINKKTGYTDEELASFYTPDSWCDNEEDIEKLNIANKEVIDKGKTVVEQNTAIKDGKNIYTEYNSTALKSPDGKSDYIVCVGRDITDRRQAEEALQKAYDNMEQLVAERTADLAQELFDRKKIDKALRESEERIRLLLNSTAEGIYGLDRNGHCTFCNSACLDLLGYKDEKNLLGKNMHDLIHYSRSDGSKYSEDECKIYKAFQQQTPGRVGLKPTTGAGLYQPVPEQH